MARNPTPHHLLTASNINFKISQRCNFWQEILQCIVYLLLRMLIIKLQGHKDKKNAIHDTARPTKPSKPIKPHTNTNGRIIVVPEVSKRSNKAALFEAEKK